MKFENIVRGSTWSFQFNFKINGVAIDQTGGTLFFTVKRSWADSDDNAIIQKVVPGNGQSTTVTVVPDDTENVLDLNRDLYADIKFVDAAGNVHEPSEFVGKIKILPNITRRRA